MPNQIDYKQNINTVPRRDGVLRFAASISEPIILRIEPAEFGYTNSDIAEMHLYEISTERLIASAYVPLSSGLISARVYTENDITYTQDIVFEMTELTRQYFPLVPPGLYDITVNFFSDMVGSEANDDKLEITVVSPSRKEIVVKFSDTPTASQLREIKEFTPPSVNKRLAQGIIEQLFRSKNILDNTATEFESLETPDIHGVLANTQAGIRLQYIDQYDRLLSFMPDLLDKIYKMTIIHLVEASKTDSRIQQSELELFITTAIKEEVTTFISDGHFDARVEVS
jgi:hypothetical protein